jgi:hypothetical protein
VDKILNQPNPHREQLQGRDGKLENENKSSASPLGKYWLSVALLALTATSFASPPLALFTAFAFTFLVPGLVFLKFFRVTSVEAYAIVPIASVLVSTQFVYYLSLAVGYSKPTILATFLLLTVVYTLVVRLKGEILRLRSLRKIGQIKKTSILLFVVIFAIALVVLLQSVWSTNQYGIVLTGSNWQDTPLHYEIIESLNCGNFPPQMSYYAGQPLTYHYFVDFHTAIVENMVGYLPQLLPFLNAVFIGIFGVAIYALAREHGRRTAIISSVIAVFGAGFSYYTLLSALAKDTFSPFTNYAYQYSQLFGLPPVFDNLLQQRPLLIGLPVFALVLLLLRNLDDKNRLLLAGVLTGLVYQFHNVSFFCCYVAFLVVLFLNRSRIKISQFLYFVVPSVLALPFILEGGLGGTQFAFSPAFPYNFAVWNPILYYVLNLGVPLLVAIVAFFKIKGHNLLKGALVALIFIPNFFVFTPNVWDMYKFFIFAWVPIAVLCGAILGKTRKSLALLLIVLSVMTTVSVISYNVGTNYSGATWDEYNLGLWVRANTPERSVFLTSAAIHSPPAMIGGRFVVCSYVNWPYGHGIPLDQVYTRTHDIDRAFNGTENDLQQVVEAYNVSYVYVGYEESRNYPGCINRLNQVPWLAVAYTAGALRIYEVNATQLGV